MVLHFGLDELKDASLLVSRLRVVKSKQEQTFVRKASQLADDAWAGLIN